MEDTKTAKEEFLELLRSTGREGVYNPQNETFRHSRTSRLFS